MPYIQQKERDVLDYAADLPQTAGELNYMFTQFSIDYVRRKGKNYQHYNDVMGALEGCKQEFYRRAVAPYEDTKIQENGDVY